MARKLTLPKATVYRILNTLEVRGYLDRSTGGSYCVARKLFDMQRTVPVEQMLQRVAPPLMERLVGSCSRDGRWITRRMKSRAVALAQGS